YEEVYEEVKGLREDPNNSSFRLANKCFQRWDAGEWYLLRRGCEGVGYASYPHPKTTEDVTVLGRYKSQILSGGRGEDWEPPPCPHEVPLLTLTAAQVIKMDEPTAATDSSGVPSAIEKSLLDFAHEDGASDQGTTAPESRKRGHDGIDTTAPPKSLQKDHAGFRPSGSSHGGKSLAAMQLCMASNIFVSEGAPADVSDPDPLSLLMLRHTIPLTLPSLLKVLLPSGTQSLRIFLPLLKLGLREVYTGRNRVSPMVAYSTPLRPARISWTMLLPRVARRDQRIQARESKLKNLEALLETEVSNKRLSQQVDALQQQVSGEETLKAAFEEYKRQQDQLVEQRCMKIDARMDALSIDFDEELYPHMLTAIIGRSSSVIKRFKVSFAGSVGGLEGCTYGRNNGCLILGERHWGGCPTIYTRPPSHSSQLAIPMYPEVRDPRNPWAYKEEIKLSDAIAANISRAEKKKKCRIVCGTHGVGSAHHAKSDGVPMSVPTVVPQGLSLLLVDAATQTDLEDV
nr:hypothetical protein [Tanacetum cinerariifolium]